MATKSKNYPKPFNFLKTWFSADKPVTIPPGGAALIFEDHRQIQTLLNGLADADSWTGYNYAEKALAGTTLIKN